MNIWIEPLLATKRTALLPHKNSQLVRPPQWADFLHIRHRVRFRLLTHNGRRPVSAIFATPRLQTRTYEVTEGYKYSRPRQSQHDQQARLEKFKAKKVGISGISHVTVASGYLPCLIPIQQRPATQAEKRHAQRQQEEVSQEVPEFCRQAGPQCSPACNHPCVQIPCDQRGESWREQKGSDVRRAEVVGVDVRKNFAAADPQRQPDQEDNAPGKHEAAPDALKSHPLSHQRVQQSTCRPFALAGRALQRSTPKQSREQRVSPCGDHEGR